MLLVAFLLFFSLLNPIFCYLRDSLLALYVHSMLIFAVLRTLYLEYYIVIRQDCLNFVCSILSFQAIDLSFLIWTVLNTWICTGRIGVCKDTFNRALIKLLITRNMYLFRHFSSGQRLQLLYMSVAFWRLRIQEVSIPWTCK